jgi:hypothetical protein
MKLQIAPDLIWRLLDGDAVIVSPAGGQVRVLNGIGTTIWQLLAEARGIHEITDYLVTHYNVSLEQAQMDLQSFIDDLSEREMIEWND